MKPWLKRFFFFQRNAVLIALSSALLLIVFAVDIAFTSPLNLPVHLYWLREVLILLAFSALGLVLYDRRRTEEKNIFYKLRTFFLAVLGLYIALLIPHFVFDSQSAFSLQRVLSYYPAVQEALKNLYYALFFSLFMIIFFFLLKDLVFYKSRKGTRRLFGAALFLLVVTIIYNHYARLAGPPDWTFHGKSPLEWLANGLLFVILILLSFRTSWVAYLNKRQKYLAFWGGLLLLPGPFLIWQSRALDVISRYSVTLGAFDTFVFDFFRIYLAMAEINLLLHLPTASIFEKKMTEIASLQNLSRIISSVLDYDELIAKVTALAKEVLHADFTWLEMVENSGSQVRVVSSQGLTRKEIEKMALDTNSGISGWIIRNRRSILINEIGKDPRSKYLRGWKKNIGSLLGVPLISQNRVMGILHAVKREEFGFDQDDRQMLEAFANQVTVAIENARLIRESIEKERLEQELRVAHDTQLKLLPKKMPEIPGLEIDATCITANEVGGDYFDFIPLAPDKLGIVIADVSGKGLSAAFYMAELKGIVNAFARQYEHPDALLKKVNQTLYQNVDRQTFVSMIYAIVNAKQRSIRFCRAGHNPPIYYSRRRDELMELQTKGIGLALDSGKIFDRMIEEKELHWEQGDFIFFYTDGLVEARNPRGEEFGEKRLMELLWKMRERPAMEIRQAIVQEVQHFSSGTAPHDDFSIVIMKTKEG